MFGRKKLQRLYYPTSKKWYVAPRRQKIPGHSRKIFSRNIRTHFTRIFKNAFYFSVITGILMALITVLLFSSYLSIVDIQVVRENFNIDTAAISNDLNRYLGKNILFFQKDGIIRKIQQDFPEFASVKVSRIFPHALKIYLESYPIVANLKAYYILPETQIQEDKTVQKVQEALNTAFSLGGENDKEEEPKPIEQKCLLNSIGQAICDHEEDLGLITVTIQNLTQPIEDREIAIPKEHMDYMLETIHYFNNLFKMQVRAIDYLPIAREIHLKTDSNIVIWLTVVKDYREQLDKLAAIYETAELNKEDIAYIDLRVKEKVIYCPVRSNCNR
jgi:cell division septal protein FtsQ